MDWAIYLFGLSILVPLTVFLVLKFLPRELCEIVGSFLPLLVMVLLMAWLGVWERSYTDSLSELVRILLLSSWNVVIAIGLFGLAAGYCFFSRTRMIRMGLYLLVLMICSVWVPMLNLPRIEHEFHWFFLLPSFFAILPFFVIGVHLGRRLRRLVLKQKMMRAASDE